MPFPFGKGIFLSACQNRQQNGYIHRPHQRNPRQPLPQILFHAAPPLSTQSMGKREEYTRSDRGRIGVKNGNCASSRKGCGYRGKRDHTSGHSGQVSGPKALRGGHLHRQGGGNESGGGQRRAGHPPGPPGSRWISEDQSGEKRNFGSVFRPGVGSRRGCCGNGAVVAGLVFGVIVSFHNL